MTLFWHSLAEVPADFGPTAVTIGNFDGVHRGHRRVLDSLAAAAATKGARTVVVTFDPHPAQVHRPESCPELIMGITDRLQTLTDAGVDAVLVVNYTLDFAAQSPREFVQGYLVDGLHAAAVVIGHDTRFGAGNSGDVGTMQELGAEFGFSVDVVDELGTQHDGDTDRRCSSTWVREALSEGRLEEANSILGRHHRMRGEVVHGAARGRELGFPTANLAFDAEGLIPADGVYAGWLVDEAGVSWPAAISVGTNPTFEGVDQRQVEAHVINRPQELVEDFNLYGQQVVVQFVSRLRGMVAYTGPEALVEQMNLDVAQTRDILSETYRI